MTILDYVYQTSGFTNTYVDATTPTTAYKGSTLTAMNIGNYTSRFGLMYFPLMKLPNDVTIKSAILKLYKGNTTVTGDVNLHAVTSPWKDGVVTWDTRPTYESTPSASVIAPTIGRAEMQIDITALVRRWANGDIPNQGIAFISTAVNSLLLSTRNESFEYRPSLKIEYDDMSVDKKTVHIRSVAKSTSEITIPAGAEPGDTLLAIMSCPWSQTFPEAPPEGWTYLFSNKSVTGSGQSSIYKLAVLYKKMTAGEPVRVIAGANQAVIMALKNVKGFEEVNLTFTNANSPRMSGALENLPRKSLLIGALSIQSALIVTQPYDYINVYTSPGSTADMAVTAGYVHGNTRLDPYGFNTSSQLVGFSQNLTIAALPTLNEAPTITLATENNKTLYESDVLAVNGSALDKDTGNTVIVRYQLNAGTARAITAAVSDGVTSIAFNKSLVFKSGKLYDGTTEITSALAEGTAHTLKVWVEDDQGGKSIVEERTFFVVPNRPPTLSINPIGEYTDLINNDTLTITGIAADPDDNNMKVSYKINKGLPTELFSGPGSTFEFNVKLADLEIGENIIIVDVVDSYSFKTSKTIKLNKSETLTPLLKSTQRYEIVPPVGSAKGVLLWIQRDKDLTVNAFVSMTGAGEQEVYQPLVLSNSAPVNQAVVEDEYILESVDPKEKIILKLELIRESTVVNPAITLISGVLS